MDPGLKVESVGSTMYNYDFGSSWEVIIAPKVGLFCLLGHPHHFHLITKFKDLTSLASQYFLLPWCRSTSYFLGVVVHMTEPESVFICLTKYYLLSYFLIFLGKQYICFRRGCSITTQQRKSMTFNNNNKITPPHPHFFMS